MIRGDSVFPDLKGLGNCDLICSNYCEMVMFTGKEVIKM